MDLNYWIAVVWLLRLCYCYENLSRRPSTTVSQSSTLRDRRARLINDGDYSTLFWKCAHTGYNYSKAWVQVDLGESYRINSVKIYYRMEDKWKPKRFRHFYLDVSDLPVTQTTTSERTRCYSDHTNYPDFPPNKIDIVCRYTARYVIVETIYDAPDDTHDGAILEICEIEVYACDGKLYGENCSIPCGQCYKAAQCHHINGTCFGGCDQGYQGDKCIEECRAGYFGENCNNTCGNCLNNGNNSTCHHVSGSCSEGCKPGYQEPTCKEQDKAAQTTLTYVFSIFSSVIGLASMMAAIFFFFKIKQKRFHQNRKHDVNDKNTKLSSHEVAEQYDELHVGDPGETYTALKQAEQETTYEEI